MALLLMIMPLMLQVPVHAQTTTAFGLSLPLLEADIENQMVEGGIPSLQAGIIINDTLVWAKGFGDQPSLDTVFRIGSITKTFTATAFLQLHEQGLVDLDADVSDYIPFEVRNPTDPSVVITARMLLSHRAGMTQDYDFGIPYFGNTLYEFLNDNFGESFPLWTEPRPPLEEIINSTNIADPDLWMPSSGTLFSYSNSGFFFLSFLLEMISNQSYFDYINENILTPLGMSSTGLSLSEFSGRVAIPYGTLENGSSIAFPHFEHYSYGSASLLTTVQDLSKFLIAHANNGSYNDIQLLESQSVDTMHSPISNSYGLGWESGVYEGHGGGHYGFLSGMWYNEHESGLNGDILLVNRRDIPGENPSFTASKNQILSLLHQRGRDMLEWTNLTTTDQGFDLVLLGGVSVGAAAVVVAAVFILKRKQS